MCLDDDVFGGGSDSDETAATSSGADDRGLQHAQGKLRRVSSPAHLGRGSASAVPDAFVISFKFLLARVPVSSTVRESASLGLFSRPGTDDITS
jgi:hypothetical protein